MSYSSNEILNSQANSQSSFESLFKDLSVPAGLCYTQQTTYYNDPDERKLVKSFITDVVPCSTIDHLTNLAIVNTNKNVTKTLKPKNRRKTRRKIQRS